MTVQHPVDRHLVAVPPVCGESLELRPGGLVVGQLRFGGEHLGAARRAIAQIETPLNAGKRGVLRVARRRGSTRRR